MTAALAAPYTTDDENPASRPAMLPLLMMLPEPWRRIWGAACFMPSITLRTSVAIAASKRSTSRPSMPPICAGPPALLNRQSMRPNFVSACPISARIWSSTVTSVLRKMQLLPSFFASASPSGTRRPAMTILAPSATNISAVRRPMPLVAPVITATLPSSRPMSFSSFWAMLVALYSRLEDATQAMPAAVDVVFVWIADRLTGPMAKLIDEFRRGWQGPAQPSPPFGAGFAACCLALSTAARWGLSLIRPDVFFTPYLPAVFFAPAGGGLRGGIATALASGVLGVTVNFGDTAADSARLALLLIYLIVCGVSHWGL